MVVRNALCMHMLCELARERFVSFIHSFIQVASVRRRCSGALDALPSAVHTRWVCWSSGFPSPLQRHTIVKEILYERTTRVSNTSAALYERAACRRVQVVSIICDSASMHSVRKSLRRPPHSGSGQNEDPASHNNIRNILFQRKGDKLPANQASHAWRGRLLDV